MTDQTPKITVIVAVRNAATTLERALNSVFEQTYKRAELIVIDGASSDGTIDIIQRNAYRLAHWESKPDRGVYHAWNKALDRATGDWICFLGADDRFHDPGVLSRVVPSLVGLEDSYRVIYGRLRLLDQAGGVLRTLGEPWDRAVFADHMSTPHPATFHHRTLFERHGRFREDYRIAGDYEFLLRELTVADAAFLPEVIADMEAGGLSNQSGSASTLAREIHRARSAHGLETAPAWRSRSVIRPVVRHLLAGTVGPRATRGLGAMYRFIKRAWPSE